MLIMKNNSQHIHKGIVNVGECTEKKKKTGLVMPRKAMAHNPQVICGMEAVWSKSSHSYPSPQPSGVCDPDHPTFLSTQSFAPMYSWSLLLSIFARHTIPGWVLLLLLWPNNRFIGYAFQIWYSRQESWLLHSIQKMGSWAPMQWTMPWTTQQSFFLHGSVWKDSWHRWLHCAWLKNEESCMGPPS